MIRGRSISRRIPSLALMVFVFYALNMDTILGMRRLNPYFYQVVLFLAVVLASYIGQAVRSGASSVSQMRMHPVMAWGMLYVGISVLSLAVASRADYAAQGVLYAASTAVMVWTATVAFAPPARPSNWRVGFVAVGVLVVACISLLLDPIMDFRARFGIEAVTAYERTRAGGIFFQPNLAGSAIPFLLATVIPRVRPKLGLLCAVLALAAVSLTFSRSGLILILLVVAMGYVRGYLPRGWSLVAVLVCALALAWIQGSTVVEDVFHIDEGSGLARLRRTTDFVSRDALESDVRSDIVAVAWSDVRNGPLVGRGGGFSWYWADSHGDMGGTHNMYLRDMLDYGWLGVLLWPLYLWALFRGRNKALDIPWVVGLLGIAAVAALFSHNLTEQGAFLIPLMGAVSLPVPLRSRPRAGALARELL